jgi:hypothetical protein
MTSTAARAARADWTDAQLEALVRIGHDPSEPSVRDALRFLRRGLEGRRRARTELRKELATHAQPAISHTWLRELGVHESALAKSEARLLRALADPEGDASCPTALGFLAEDLAFTARSYRFVADRIAHSCL